MSAGRFGGSPDALAAFERLAAVLEDAGAVRGAMMGRPMLATHARRMFACLDSGRLGLRLGRGTREFDEALARPGAAVFAPGDGSRSFADWVALPVSEEAVWERFALLSYRRRLAD